MVKVWLGWWPWVATDSIVVIRIIAVIIIVDCPENIFNVWSPFSWLICGINKAIAINIEIFFSFFVLLISFDTRDAVYINRVIIPEANVRIVMKETHLVNVDLNMTVVARRERKRIDSDVVIGFMFFLVVNDTSTITVAIFLCSFGLQNQCSLNF